MSDRSTADALLDAAEATFAAHGIDGGSLRAIMRDAGANPAAVHYHFGSRETLAGAVLDRILQPIQDRRLQRFDGLAGRAEPPTVTDLIEALVGPDLEMALELNARSPGGARLLGWIYVRPSAFVTSMVEERFAPIADRFMPEFAKALPHLDHDTIGWRVRWFVFGTIGAILADDHVMVTASTVGDVQARLVDAAAGALTAPATP